MTRTEKQSRAIPEIPPLGVETVRSRFPALHREVGGRAVAYFDGPGGTQVPAAVADAVRDYLLHHNGNAGWRYPTSCETDAIVDAARSALADLLGGRPDEVAFGPSMTALTLRISRALGRILRPGDRVVVTELDHHANVDPWKALETERGTETRTVRMDPATGTLDMDDLADAVASARILAITAASNALGTIPDLPTAVRLARDAGALVYVDAVHYAPHVLPDVVRLGADFVAASPYKFYGPHLGVVWGRTERIQVLDVPRVASAPDNAPDRLETGTLAFEALAGATAAVDFLASVGGDHREGGRRARLRAGYSALHHRGEALFQRLWDGLADLTGVTLYGPPPGQPRTPTLGFTVDGISAGDAADRLASRGLFLSHGDFYATTVIDRLGVRERGGLLRAGIVAYTTAAEVDRLVDGVAGLARA